MQQTNTVLHSVSLHDCYSGCNTALATDKPAYCWSLWCFGCLHIARYLWADRTVGTVYEV